MLPANALLLICPFCNGEKPVLQLMSGNTFRGYMRSDLKRNYPMMPKVSPIQKCPHCGKYYYTSAVKTRQGDNWSLETGELSYQETLESIQQFEQQNLSNNDEIQLLILFVHAYNSMYQSEDAMEQLTPTDEEREFFRQKIERLLEIWETEDLVRAEFFRETSKFEECLNILDNLKNVDPFRKKIAQRIAELATQKSTKVFLLSQD